VSNDYRSGSSYAGPGIVAARFGELSTPARPVCLEPALGPDTARHHLTLGAHSDAYSRVTAALFRIDREGR
jgi:hypothetical protein